jgi:hypothetical protein
MMRPFPVYNYVRPKVKDKVFESSGSIDQALDIVTLKK